MLKQNTVKKEINVNNNKIRIMKVNKVDYISLTDLARYANPEDPSGVIRNWMTNKNSFSFYSLWEELNNPNFNSVESHRIKIDEVPYNRFTMTPNKWKKDFNSIGIIPSCGRHSKGTYAHPDIAFEFASWLSPEFKMYLIKEFQRLKEIEQKQLGWSVKREISKINYKIHTDAIKNNLIPKELTKEQINCIYSEEADVLNMALFGKTAKQWHDETGNKKENMRDYASVEQLIILVNIESMNADMIREGIPMSERLKKLRGVAYYQMQSLTRNKSIERIKDNLIEKKNS